MERAWKGLCEGYEQIPVGTAESSFQKWEVLRQEEMKGAFGGRVGSYLA